MNFGLDIFHLLGDFDFELFIRASFELKQFSGESFYLPSSNRVGGCAQVRSILPGPAFLRAQVGLGVWACWPEDM